MTITVLAFHVCQTIKYETPRFLVSYHIRLQLVGFLLSLLPASANSCFGLYYYYTQHYFLGKLGALCKLTWVLACFCHLPYAIYILFPMFI